MNITFLGDIFPANEALFRGFGIKSQFDRHRGEIWKESVKAITGTSDFVVGNLESPLLSTEFTEKDNFYGNPRFASFLMDCGVNYLNVANNHILEHGVIGYNHTIETLQKENIGIIGDRNRVVFIEAKKCKIAIAGFCDAKLSCSIPDTYSVLNEENLKNALQKMNDANADLKIFYFHWGDEYIHKPSPEQRKLATEMIDAGADIIIGHHPHVVQPYEQYKQGHIFYSLGNFCFDNPFQSRQFSIGMGATIDYNTETKSIRQIDVFGIRLSMKVLACKMPTSQFLSYFDKIQKKYCKIKEAKGYNERYRNELAIRHIIERSLMKLSLVKLFFYINKEEKRMLLKNMSHYYLR